MTLETAPASATRCAAASRGRKWLTAWRAKSARQSNARSAPSASSRRAHARARARALAGLPALRSTTRLSALRSSAAGRLLRHHEHPLVVMVAPLIEANRLVLAPAADAHDPANHGSAESAAGTRAEAAGRRDAAATARGGLPAPTWPRRLARLAGGSTPRGRRRLLPGLTGNTALADKLKVVVVDRIFVFFADKSACHEQVDATGHRLRAGLVQPQGAHVLLAAEDQFFFLFALRLLAPDRQRDGHQHRHHRQRDQQGGHRETALGTTRLTSP